MRSAIPFKILAVILSRLKKSDLQQVKQLTFKEAVAYAQSIIRNKTLKAAYAVKLEKGQTIYHAAIKEFMNRGNKLRE